MRDKEWWNCYQAWLDNEKQKQEKKDKEYMNELKELYPNYWKEHEKEVAAND